MEQEITRNATMIQTVANDVLFCSRLAFILVQIVLAGV